MQIADAPWIREACALGYPVDLDDAPLSAEECFPMEDEEWLD